MRILSYVVMGILQVVLLPLAIPALVWASYKQIVVSKRLGASQTGVKVLGGRWMMHHVGLREDAEAGRLQRALPNCSSAALWVALFPLWAQYKLSGRAVFPRVPPPGRETIADAVPARTLQIDRMIERALPGVEQLVILGAGYDTRPYGRLRREGVRFFELDRPETQRVKVEALRKAGIDSDHVTFVEVDFEKAPFTEPLLAAGYEPSKKTLFLWEGVTLYLTQEDILSTLSLMRSHAPSGSTVVVDFYGEPMARVVAGAVRRASLAYTGESFTFVLPTTDPEGAVAALATKEGLTVREAQSLGTDAKQGTYAVIAVLGW